MSNVAMLSPVRSAIPDIAGAWKAYKEKKIKQSPSNTLRASSIGTPCDRYHYYSIKNWRDKALHDAVTQSIFDEGSLHEIDVMRQLVEMGFVVVEQQRSFQIDKPLVTGHIDGIIRWEGADYPFDVKSISPYEFDRIQSAEDLLFSKKSYQRRYPAQLQIYLLQCNAEVGCFILKNKLTGELKPIWMQIDYDYCEQLLKRAERVYEFIKQETLPSRTENFDECRYCPFKELCLPDIQFNNAVSLIDDAELSGMLERREELQKIAKEFSDIDDAIKDHFKILGAGERICGEFAIKTTEIKSTKKIPITFSEQQTSYLKTQILKIKK